VTGGIRVDDETEQRRICGNCRHWDAESQGRAYVHVSYPGSTVADIQTLSEQYRRCGGVPYGASQQAEDEVLAPAFVMDEEVYSADLWTRADFGCVLWEGSA
jgi:hypothetical protein